MSNIKSVTLYKYDYVLKDMNSEEFELKGGVYNKTTYNPEGSTLSEIKYDNTGGVEEHYEYEYNDKGVKTAERSFDESGDLIDEMQYSTDANGKILFGYKNYLDGSKDTITYRYDNKGNLVEKEVRTDEDEVEFIDKFTYDGDNEILHESWNEENELVFSKETTWDENGNILEATAWMAETGETGKMANTYDDKGQLVSVISYNENGEVLFKVEYERDKDQQITMAREESQQSIVITHIEYDDKGNPVVQEEKNEKGELNSRIERKYDDEGNVTESEAILDRHGTGMNQHYILKYENEFY